MTVPVRRHLYIQRSFTGIFVKEFNEDFYNITLEKVKKRHILLASVKDMINTGFEKISHSLTIPGFQGYSSISNEEKGIVFVLPIAERFEIFNRFLKNFEDVAINNDKNVDLLIVIFGDSSSTYKHLRLLADLKEKHIKRKINYIHINEQFSRGIALDTASRSSYIDDNDIIFFIDVDMKFTHESLDRIRMNTVQGKQVYLPIVFSGYDPSRLQIHYEPEDVRVEDGFGFFRQFGYGICAIYKSDIMDPEINGFDKDIKGWGLEDVRFLEKLIKIGNRQNSFLVNTSDMPENYNYQNSSNFRKLNIFRSPDPSLIHIYHPINCDENLEFSQYTMCLGSKANTLGNRNIVEDMFLRNKSIINYIRNVNDNVRDHRNL